MARLFRLTLRAALLLVPFALVGCADDYGEACDMPNTPSFNAACASTENNDGTCTFRNAPECSSRLCARYQGSRDFCTVACDVEVENSCPGDSICYAPAGRASRAICVPRDIYEGDGS
jgi:hypothetical protein